MKQWKRKWKSVCSGLPGITVLFLAAFIGVLALDVPQTLTDAASAKDNKAVTDETELTDNGEEIRFQGRAQITNMEKIESIVLEDELHPAFRFKSLQVWNDKGEDISEDGEITITGQLIQYRLEGEKAQEYIGRYIEWEIVVHYIEGSDLSDLEDHKIPNQMRLYVNEKESESNEVHVKPAVLADSIRKTVRNDETEDALEYILETNDEEILFTGHIQINNTSKINNVVLEDNLHPALHYQGMNVYDEQGEDISSQGEVEKEGQKLRFVFSKEAAQTLTGKTITWKITAHYIEGSDLSGLKDNKVPNTMQLYVNGEKETSNTVHVVPVPLADQMYKAVLDEDGEETDYLEMSDNDTPIVFRGKAQIGNTVEPESIELRDELHPAFAFEQLYVYDSRGTDYTKKGEIYSEGQEIRFVLTGDEAAGLTGRTLFWEVTVTYREGTDLSNLEENKVPNTMQLIVNGNETESDEVFVKPDPLPDKIVKTILGEDDSEIDSLVLSDNDQDIVFRGSIQVNNVAHIKSIVLQDELHPAFRYVHMMVYDADGTDITEQGEIKADKQLIQFVFAEQYAAELVASQLYWELTVNYIEGSDLSELENGAIPNRMQLFVNENETESDEVLVTPIPMDNAIVKSIIDRKGNKVTTFRLEHNQEEVSFSGQAVIPNNEKPEQIVLRDHVDEAFVVARESIRVYTGSGEDITSTGKVQLDQKNMLEFTIEGEAARSLPGQDLIWEFDVRYADHINFNQEQITFNTMEISMNDQITESNEVEVIPRVMKTALQKPDKPGGSLVRTGDPVTVAVMAGLFTGALLFLVLQLVIRKRHNSR